METIKHGNTWLGEQATYSSKHKWLVKTFGNFPKCEMCGVIGEKNKGDKWTIQYANISGKHYRDIKDYKGLCTKCHKIFDGKTKSIEDYKHGEYGKYRRGCRCDLCKESKRITRSKKCWNK